jgi:hypothetical protein
MIRCEECLRANPPTRVNCLYCAAVLPHDETTVNLQKPALRPLEKWEQGYNNILRPPAANLTESQLAEAADLLRLDVPDLTRILLLDMPLPVARAASNDEASLVQRRLSGLGIETSIVSDAALGADERGPVKVRALEIDETGMSAFQTPETPAIHVSWSNFALLVTGRLIVKRVVVNEQKRGRTESRITDASEFFTDEPVFDLYATGQRSPFRIAANSFDFSCLGKRKSLLAGENISLLIELFRDKAPHAKYDDSYNSMRKALEVVWPSGQESSSAGWRRERPGKYSIGLATETSNERQFLWYSRLRYYLLSEVRGPSGQATQECPPG